MSHDPKLEIYKVRLLSKDEGRPTQFRNSFRTKISSISSITSPNDSDFYREFYKDFVNSIDGAKGYRRNTKKEKAFKVAKEDLGNGNIKSKLNSPTDDNFIISGILEGGKYGIRRNLGNVEDGNVVSPINRNNVVGDWYYFLLYAPINHDTGILLIQGYTEGKISDIFREHIVDYFTVEKKVICQTEIFIPEQLKQKYLSNAIFSSAKFSSGFIIKNGFGDLENKELDLEVKIEIIDKSNKKVKYTLFNKMLEAFGDTIIHFPNEVRKKLSSFEKKSAKMKGTGKEFPIDFNNEDNIKPVILLKDQGIKISEDKIPDFDQINTYCRNLLQDILDEIMPHYAIKDI